MFLKRKEVNTKSIFKDVRDLKVNQSKYPIKTPEEIKARIEAADAAGEESVFYANAHVLKSTVEELKQKGYKVKDRSYCGGPSFEIFW